MCIPAHCTPYERDRSADLYILCNSGRSLIAFRLSLSLLFVYVLIILCECSHLQTVKSSSSWTFTYDHMSQCLICFVYVICVSQIICCSLFSNLYIWIAFMHSSYLIDSFEIKLLIVNEYARSMNARDLHLLDNLRINLESVCLFLAYIDHHQIWGQYNLLNTQNC